MKESSVNSENPISTGQVRHHFDSGLREGGARSRFGRPALIVADLREQDSRGRQVTGRLVEQAFY